METVAQEPPKDATENAQAEASSVENTPEPPSEPSPAATAAPSQPPQQDRSKKSKRDDKNKKYDEYVDQFTKAINGAPTLEKKMQIACQRYTDMVDDSKKMQFYVKQSVKRHGLLLREKEQLQLEFNKTILVKSKLENLCRELQKQNKAIKEESLHKIREEEERRKETQAKFQNTLSEITTLLQQNNEKNAKLRDDNIGMKENFNSVLQQYQLREQQVEKMSKQMALEQQLADAKFLKAGLEHQAERERLLAEMEGLKVTAAQYRAKVMELQGTESGLRSQLAVYTDKYDEFQNALVKSNQVFGGFKEEMEKMSKKIKKLEKESLSWKKRWETSQTALLDMCSERQAGEERSAGLSRQLHNMQSLCRTLQAERTVLLNTLKENNIERPPLAAPAPAPPPPPPAPASNAKVDAMAANCAQLRQSLAHLQTQLNVLTNKQQTPPPEEQPVPETKNKKSKSKKAKKAAKESGSDSNTKESATENESANEDKTDKVIKETNEVPAKTEDKQEVDNVPANDKTEAADAASLDIADEKVDEKTLDTLIQAINNANINLSDFEVVGDDKLDLEEVLDAKPTEIANDVTQIETTELDSQNGPKIIELTDSKIEVKVNDVNDKVEASKVDEPKVEIETSKGNDVVIETANIGVPKEVKQVANKEIKAGVSKSTAQAKDA